MITDDFIATLEAELLEAQAHPRRRVARPLAGAVLAAAAIALVVVLVGGRGSHPPAERTVPAARTDIGPGGRVAISARRRAPTAADRALWQTAPMARIRQGRTGVNRLIESTLRIARTYNGAPIILVSTANGLSCMFALDTATQPTYYGGCIPAPTRVGAQAQIALGNTVRVGLVHDGIREVHGFGFDGTPHTYPVVNNVFVVPATQATYVTWDDHGTQVRAQLADGIQLFKPKGNGRAYVLPADEYILTIPILQKPSRGKHFSLWLRGTEGDKRLVQGPPVPHSPRQLQFRRPANTTGYDRFAITVDTRPDRIGRVLFQGPIDGTVVP